MTTDHHTQALRWPKIQAHQRQLKVRETFHSYQLNQNTLERTPIGEIHLKGKWLIQAGFEIDTPVKVRVMEGCLVLTTDT
jgi:toxic protein SymE